MDSTRKSSCGHGGHGRRDRRADLSFTFRRGHEVGARPTIHRTRESRTAWVRRQILTFEQVLPDTLRPSRSLPPARLMRVDPTPQDVGDRHIRINRWVRGDGDGVAALGEILDGLSYAQLRRYLDEPCRDEYRQLYGSSESHVAEAAFRCIDTGAAEMVDDVAQFAVDQRRCAVVMCREAREDDDDDATIQWQVTLLVPRHTMPGIPHVSSRCLILKDRGWSVGDWSLEGDYGEDDVPLFGLPVIHPWWRKKFWTAGPGLVTGFREHWGMYASHDVTR